MAGWSIHLIKMCVKTREIKHRTEARSDSLKVDKLAFKRQKELLSRGIIQQVAEQSGLNPEKDLIVCLVLNIQVVL